MECGVRMLLFKSYFDVITYGLKRSVPIRSTNLVVHPYTFWVSPSLSPDGFMLEDSSAALIEIKCPYSKRNMKPEVLVMCDQFYEGLKNGKPFLKENHSFWHNTQILPLGCFKIEKCCFVVYTYRGLIIC